MQMERPYVPENKKYMIIDNSETDNVSPNTCYQPSILKEVINNGRFDRISL